MTRLSISRAAGPDWCFHELKIRPRNVCLTLDRSIWSREHPWLGPKQFWVDLGQNFRSACSTFSDFGQYIVADSTVLRQVLIFFAFIISRTDKRVRSLAIILIIATTAVDI